MLKLWLVLALACASAPAATQVVILGTGTPRADPARSGPAVAVVCNGCDVLLHEVYSLVDAKRPEPGWIEYLREFHTSSTELAQIAAKAKPKLLVLYHQLIRGTTDKVLVKEVRKDYRGRVVSAHDLDLY
jgi:ribonuclease BN (tRNA processing enzyme)